MSKWLEEKIKEEWKKKKFGKGLIDTLMQMKKGERLGIVEKHTKDVQHPFYVIVEVKRIEMIDSGKTVTHERLKWWNEEFDWS